MAQVVVTQTARVIATTGARAGASALTRGISTGGGRALGGGVSSSGRTITTEGARTFSQANPMLSSAGRSGAQTAGRSGAQTVGRGTGTGTTIASNPGASTFTSKSNIFTRTFNSTFRGTTTPLPRKQATTSSFSRSSANPLSSGGSRGAGQGARQGGAQGARQGGKTWAGKAKSAIKGTAIHLAPTLATLPLVLLQGSPLKGLENMLNPANWVQDLSWLGGLLNPANWGQDLSWLEGLLGGLGKDMASAFGGMERFAEGAFRDAETGVKDVVWGAEEVFKWAPYIGGFIALFWVINTVRGK